MHRSAGCRPSYLIRSSLYSLIAIVASSYLFGLARHLTRHLTNIEQASTQAVP